MSSSSDNKWTDSNGNDGNCIVHLFAIVGGQQTKVLPRQVMTTKVECHHLHIACQTKELMSPAPAKTVRSKGEEW